ncbi:EAL domain-containing protein [Nisaea acidiphila]|uniref:EAL domain-containing protein n=1 Tax=Nisaea acidiphila TaxID=1862145 RepID=A0A9J7APZ0_9PROT|nr:EAL domain-containing protein [Nisaea acidiphila]UUX49675.1 EAL domain-containing protein [Nisaea acidiphila]
MSDLPRLWLYAVRDAFVSLLPVTVFRVLIQLVQFLPVPGYHAYMTSLFGEGWDGFLGRLADAGYVAWGVGSAIAVAIFVHRRLVRRRAGHDPLPSTLVGLCALLNVAIFALLTGRVEITALGYDVILEGALIGLLTAHSLDLLSRWRMPAAFRLAYDAEITVSQALHACLPTFGAGLATVPVILLLDRVSIPAADFVGPLDYLASVSGLGGWLYQAGSAVLNHVSWFFGVHGGLILLSISDLLFAAPESAFDPARGHLPLYNLFVLLGGAGATLGLLLAIAIAVREGGQLRVAKLALLPSLFNINEIVLFGLPVVLNPVYLLPFVGVPVLLALLSYGAVAAGLFELRPLDIPWTTPPLISGWMLTGSWRGAAFQLFEIMLAAMLYLPFVRIAERQRRARRSEDVLTATEAVLAETIRVPVIHRTDMPGYVARGLLGDLRDAIAHGRLELHYQPKVDREGRVHGFEALLRWPHPAHGRLSPMLAVLLAEDGGLIDRLGGWVIDAACACKARWNEMGHRDLVIALNVSPVQLWDPELPDRIGRALQRHGLRPQEIQLEITESHALPDDLRVEETFGRLTALGVGLVMDDFGMGHTSLVYLRRYAMQSIKLDGSLTREVLIHPANADIIRSIAALGRSRDVEIVAEYVETEPQRDALAALGCDLFQGYLYAPPMPEADCLAYLKAQGRKVRKKSGA